MKYIITDKGNVRVGSDQTFHSALAFFLEKSGEKVVGAGHCTIGQNGAVMVFGWSVGYGIKAQIEDAEKIEAHLRGGDTSAGCSASECDHAGPYGDFTGASNEDR